MSFASSTRHISKRALYTTATTTTANPISRVAFAATATARQPLFPNRRTFSATAATMGVHNLQNKAAFDEALKEQGVMVIDCFATWCGPCKAIAPQVVKFSEQFDKARFYKIDVDEVPDVAQELSIRAMPTFLIFKDGEKAGEVVGANPKALEAAIAKHF